MDAVRTLAAALLLSVAGSLPAGAADPAAFPAHDAQLLSQTGFDRDVLETVREEAQAPLHRLSGYDEDGYRILVSGIAVSVAHGRAGQVLASLRARLAPRGYQAFIIEESPTVRTDRIAVLRGTDQYEILRIMHTHGERSGIAPEDIIDTLKSWERRSPFRITGAENDWVEIEFKAMPKDVAALADEVAELCPEMAEEGAAGAGDLRKELVETRRLMLWWD
jgi:hypothetical protein